MSVGGVYDVVDYCISDPHIEIYVPGGEDPIPLPEAIRGNGVVIASGVENCVVIEGVVVSPNSIRLRVPLLEQDVIVYRAEHIIVTDYVSGGADSKALSPGNLCGRAASSEAIIFRKVICPGVGSIPTLKHEVAMPPLPIGRPGQVVRIILVDRIASVVGQPALVVQEVVFDDAIKAAELQVAMTVMMEVAILNRGVVGPVLPLRPDGLAD